MTSQATHIRWTSWGRPVATGNGLTWLWTNKGLVGPVRIALRAVDLGRCGRGPRAYRRLEYRTPSRVGGPLGRWTVWEGATATPPHTICNSY